MGLTHIWCNRPEGCSDSPKGITWDEPHLWSIFSRNAWPDRRRRTFGAKSLCDQGSWRGDILPLSGMRMPIDTGSAVILDKRLAATAFRRAFWLGLLTIGRDYLTKVDSLAVAAIEGALSLGYSRQLGGVWKGGSGSSIIVVMWPAADAASDDWRWFDV